MDLLGAFAGFQKIYGVCPCCDRVFRLSDAKLFVSSPPPRTDFDDLEDAMQRLEFDIERFEEKEEEVLRESSRKAGRDAARSRLAEIAPFFTAKRIDPNDVKVLFDPVLYLVFKGMTSGACTELQFVDAESPDEQRRKFHKSLSSALRNGNVEWRTFNVQDDGCITCS